MRVLFAALVLSLAALPGALPPWTAAPARAQQREPAPRRGDYLPADLLRAGPNVDPAAARLRRPPDGYGWFMLRGAYVMASLQTGLIVEVVGA